jgi:hypothetical protein
MTKDLTTISKAQHVLVLRLLLDMYNGPPLGGGDPLV